MVVAIPNRTSYAASKFAVQGYCESLRAELASAGVSVHIVSPGYIKTNLSRSAITGDGEKYNKSDASTENGAVSMHVVLCCLSDFSCSTSYAFVSFYCFSHYFLFSFAMRSFGTVCLLHACASIAGFAPACL